MWSVVLLRCSRPGCGASLITIIASMSLSPDEEMAAALLLPLPPNSPPSSPPPQTPPPHPNCAMLEPWDISPWGTPPEFNDWVRQAPSPPSPRTPLLALSSLVLPGLCLACLTLFYTEPLAPGNRRSPARTVHKPLLVKIVRDRRRGRSQELGTVQLCRRSLAIFYRMILLLLHWFTQSQCAGRGCKKPTAGDSRRVPAICEPTLIERFRSTIFGETGQPCENTSEIKYVLCTVSVDLHDQLV